MNHRVGAYFSEQIVYMLLPTHEPDIAYLTEIYIAALPTEIYAQPSAWSLWG